MFRNGRYVTVTNPGQRTYGEVASTDDLLSLGTLTRILWERFWVIILVASLLAGTVVGFALRQAPQYQASVKLLVGQERGIVADEIADVTFLNAITLTIGEAVQSRPIAGAVVKELNSKLTPDQVLANMSAEPIEDTQFIEVSYTDSSPERAQRIANTIGTVFSERISEESSDSNLTATVWEPAVLPGAPVSPDPMRDGFLALVLGGMLGAGLAFLLEYLDDRWRSPEEAEQVSGVPTLGQIPRFEVSEGKRRAKKGDGHNGPF